MITFAGQYGHWPYFLNRFAPIALIAVGAISFIMKEIIFNGELGMVGQFGIKKSVPLKFGINLVSIFGLFNE